LGPTRGIGAQGKTEARLRQWLESGTSGLAAVGGHPETPPAEGRLGVRVLGVPTVAAPDLGRPDDHDH
jgi:hypothetical protein